MGLVIAGALTLRASDPPQWAAILIALAPVAPALLMLRAYLALSRAMDEFQRRLQSEAMAVAIAITVFSTFAYGFLEEWADFPHVPLIWVFPVFCVLYGVAHAVIRRRYK